MNRTATPSLPHLAHKYRTNPQQPSPNQQYDNPQPVILPERIIDLTHFVLVLFVDLLVIFDRIRIIKRSSAINYYK